MMKVVKNSVLIATLATALFSTLAVMANTSDTQLNKVASNSTDTLVEQIFKPLSYGSLGTINYPCPRWPLC